MHSPTPRSATPGPAHPYLDWANDTKFAYLRPGDWVPLLVEFAEPVTRKEFITLDWLRELKEKDAVRAPALFDDVFHDLLKEREAQELRFCVLLVRSKSVADVIGDQSWKDTILSAEMGPPIDLANAPVRSAKPLSIKSAPGATVGRVVTAVIDQGIAFAHSRFRNAGGTRIAYLWQQDLMTGLSALTIPATPTKAAIKAALGPGMASAPGVEFNAAEIDARMQDARAKGGDEEMVYRASGSMNFAVDGFKPLARRRSHGTHVLDLAAGEQPHDDVTSRPIIAVDMPEDAVGDPAGASLTVQAAWGLLYILARAASLRDPNEKLGVVVNISYGPQDGPHDGSSLFERFADKLISLFNGTDLPLQVVLAAGNSRQSRAHARFSLPARRKKILKWRLQPGGLTPSFMELWLPNAGGADKVKVTLKSPLGDKVSVSSDVPNDSLPSAVNQRLGAMFRPGAPGWPRSSILLCVAPTAADPAGKSNKQIAPSGLWSVEVENPSGAKLDIDAWIRRSDTPGGRRAKGRQSYFDDPSYELDRHLSSTRPKLFDQGSSSYVKRQGTLSGIATGAETVVVGGYRRKPKPWHPNQSKPENPAPAWYSSQGPVAPSGTRTAKAPNFLAPSDDATTCAGVLAAGTRDGSFVAMNGTSVAAPQVARCYADAFAASSTWGGPTIPAGLVVPVSKEVPASDRPRVAGSGLIDLLDTRGRP